MELKNIFSFLKKNENNESNNNNNNKSFTLKKISIKEMERELQLIDTNENVRTKKL